VRKYLAIGLLTILAASILIGAATAGQGNVEIYCDCDCIDGKMYKCCNEFSKGQWYIVCEPGCRVFQKYCSEVPTQ
jgi:hypothetical protein